MWQQSNSQTRFISLIRRLTGFIQSSEIAKQSGKSQTTISGIETLPVLDFWALKKEQSQQAKTIFDRFKDKHFLPAYVADEAPIREKLDYAVLCEWLGFDEKVWKAVRGLAKKWCAEPSVHGGKQRPKNTSFIS